MGVRPVNRQRLSEFDIEALAHRISYKAAVAFSPVYAIALVLGILGSIEWEALKALSLVMWAVLTVPYYELIKGVVMVASRGVLFGNVAETFRRLLEARMRARLIALRVVFYATIVAWLLAPLVAAGLP